MTTPPRLSDPLPRRSLMCRFARPAVLLPLAVLVIGTVPGCGPARPTTYPVTGRVQFTDGDPVKTGIIELESVEHGTTATGRIQEDGTFVLGTFASEDGAVAGEHRAIVIQLIMGDGTVRHTKDHGAPVPVRYADYESSPLRLQVQPQPENVLTVTLEK